MTNSSATFVAILLGLGIFLVIVAVGWRSVQNRRILRLQGADGQETIIVASEDDDVTSVATTTEDMRPPQATPQTARVVKAAASDPDQAPVPRTV